MVKRRNLMNEINWEESIDKKVDVYQCLTGGANMYGDIINRISKEGDHYMLYLYYHNVWQTTDVSNGWWVQLRN